MSDPFGFPRSEDLRARLRAALAEDLGPRGDVTSEAVFPIDHASAARILAKQGGVLAGGPVLALVFQELDPTVEVALREDDGARLAPGQVVAELAGPTRSILAGERTALNFLQRLSGIASLTAHYVAAARGRIAVCDTRKTTPLWRDLEKYAVRCGGGTNHRMGLYDMVMLKDTHADGALGLDRALRAVAPLSPPLCIAAEARNLEEVDMALAGGADLLMLDNMPPGMIREAIHRIAGRLPVEITGGITPETLAGLADLQIDRVSVGALTHSAPAMDFSLRLSLGGVT